MKSLTRFITLTAWALATAGSPLRALELSPELFADRGAAAVLASLPATPREPDQIFAHATVELLAAVEELGRDFYEHGLQFEAGRSLPVPFLRLPLPRHPDPKSASAADVRRALEAFHVRLAEIDARLAPIEGKIFKAVIPLGAAGFDFSGKGAVADRIAFGPFFAGIAGPGGAAAAAAEAEAALEFVVAFDQTDTLWLRAYTHLLRSLADIMLAHDGGELFGSTGHLYFTRADSPFARLLAEKNVAPGGSGNQEGTIADVIAMLHRLDLAVADPARLARARTGLLEMIRLSRATLTSAAAETDDDREWLPGNTQNSVFGLRLSVEQATAWTGILGELEALLEGKKLLPHWRFSRDGYGLNLKRLFEESRRTDIIGYAQGAAAVPWLEAGPTTSLDTWVQLTRLFGGNFLGYALWIN